MKAKSSDDGAVDAALLAETSKIVGSNFKIVTPGLDLSGAALRGQYERLVLRPGLMLHYSDAIDLHDLVTRIEQKPGVTVQVFLKGRVDASIGGRDFLSGGGASMQARPFALMTARVRTELFERRASKGAHLRKVSVTMSHDWLADCGLGLNGDALELGRFAAIHLARKNWQPNRRLIGLAEQILRPAPYAGACRALYLESRVLELLAEAFSAAVPSSSDAGLGALNARDLRRMRDIEERLGDPKAAQVRLDDVAREIGVSVSTLQRLFQAAHGISAFEFIRRKNLDRARFALDGLGVSVKEAAHLAGYASAANFSTAFRRHFGRTPKQMCLRPGRP